MDICGWICTAIMFAVLCFTVQSMFDSYLSFKSENFDNDKKDEEKED